ncbi:hypothetical protein HK099_002944 [Clydaea vesicula]|uniref:Alginate lyase 2 domain-containing protein n=1 Tax=Clydaea vesicula TaxID=447962 RepID=A0AAD5U5J5_9FUNG|nr:hypothetical protein HK099_002944 [Clydaea vesicula]
MECGLLIWLIWTPGSSSNTHYAQNGNFASHEDKNIRCVEKAGLVEINSVDLISGDWTVDMINLDTFAVLPVARSDGNWVLHTPVWFSGAAAAGKYTRTELREKENWNVVIGHHSFSSSQSIDSISQNGVVVGQIMANINGEENAVVQILLQPTISNASILYLKALLNEFDPSGEKKNSETFVLQNGYQLRTRYEIKINVDDGKISILFNGILQTKNYNKK